MRRIPLLAGAFLIAAAPLAAGEIPDRLGAFAHRAALQDLLAAHGIEAKSVTFDPLRHHATIDGVVLRTRDLALRIGRLTIPLAADANDGHVVLADAVDAPGAISADDVSIDTSAFHATMKHIALSGTSLSKSDLTALLDPHSSVPAVQRLANLSAAHVAIPELILEVKASALRSAGDEKNADAQSEKITYTDIGLDDVVKGRASRASVTATSAVIQSTESGEMQIALGPAHLSNFDLVQLATLLSPPSQNAKDTTAGLCDTIAIEGVKVTVPETHSDMGMGSVTMTGINVHASAAPAGKDKNVAGFAYAYDRFDVNAIDFSDMRFAANNGATSWTGRIGHGLLTSMVADKVADAHFDDFTGTNDNGTIKIARLGWHGPGDGADAQQKMTGDALEIDVTKLPSGAAPEKPIRFLLSHFEMTNGDFADGKPRQVQAAFDHFSFDLAGLPDAFAPIASLGYDKLDLSSTLQAHLDTTTHQFTLDPLSLTGVDMGSVQLSGRFDQVTNGLFSSDQSQLESAVVRVLLHHIDIKIENSGLFDRIVAAIAKRDGVTDADVRKKFTDAATTVIPALLNHGKGSDQLAAALAKFIAEPKTLRLSVTAPDGISALDAFLFKDPAELLDRLEIEAVADQ
ncbi:MAG TPA: hypothetical protein VGG12_07675 [Methylovirgula sp.]